MNSFPTFARIRAERAVREQRGVVLPFHPPAQNEIAAENTNAATWNELWGLFYDTWTQACLTTLDTARQTQLAYEAIMEQILWQERRKEAEEFGRLIREVCGED